MKKNKSSHIVRWLMAAIIVAISYIAFMGAMKDGLTLTNNSNNKIDNMDSIDELLDTVHFPLNIPKYITESDDKLNIELIAGQIVQINTDKFVFKASSFVANDADILGLYEESKLENKYTVKNSDIKYIKYRQQYKDYPNCTLIDWCTDETTYGLMIEADISLDEALKIIGVDKKNIEEYSETADTEVDANSDYTEYSIDGVLKISLPQFSEEVTHVDTGDASAFFAGDTMLFLVDYSKQDIKNGLYSDMDCIDISNDIKIYYDSNNAYDPNTEAYDDYNIWLSAIDDICGTIVIKK